MLVLTEANFDLDSRPMSVTAAMQVTAKNSWVATLGSIVGVTFDAHPRHLHV